MCGVDRGTGMMVVRQDVHRHGVEMAIVTVCVTWHLVALMAVIAVGLGLGRVTWEADITGMHQVEVAAVSR